MVVEDDHPLTRSKELLQRYSGSFAPFSKFQILTLTIGSLDAQSEAIWPGWTNKASPHNYRSRSSSVASRSGNSRGLSEVSTGPRHSQHSQVQEQWSTQFQATPDARGTADWPTSASKERRRAASVERRREGEEKEGRCDLFAAVVLTPRCRFRRGAAKFGGCR